MRSQTDWLQILIYCKENVKESIRPHLKTMGEPQPNLGTGAGGDLIKPVDLAAEKAIVEGLQQHDISFTLVSEESGLKEFGDNPNQCYVTVDPIDGTNNLVRRIPFYATSIAISTKPVLSAIYAALVTDLAHDNTYTAQQGKGAYRNGEKISSSKLEYLDEAMVGLDLNSYEVKEIAPKLTALIQKTRHIRHFGANALELCYVADSTTDAFIDIRGKLRTTDLAAAYLIVKEAGGTVTTPTGEALDAKLDPKQTIKFIASGNPQIHKTILNLVKP
jgi:fructose-1,6-bisphosphatase/inositol monophosphatase family enzyme